ncbi:MAG: RICIN domain-containing protein, partial [Symploca sp. SIO3E6]|nr:RICIN domain-containing protein [Caldora sp. SIO3E6]
MPEPQVNSTPEETSPDNQNQKWKLVDAGDGYYFITTTNGLVLDGTGLNRDDNVLLWDKKGDDNNQNQKWKLVEAGDGYYLITTTNGLVLDGTGLSSGNNVLLWDKKGDDNNQNQKWN